MKNLTQPAISLLPDQELHDFVNYYFSRRDIYLETVQTNASPLYILKSSVLKERAEQFIKSFTRHLSKTAFYFAVKSNNHPAVSKILLESGFGLDVSSGLELKNAINLGAGDIVFSGPWKTNQEIELAIKYANKISGAKNALDLVLQENIRIAILKSKSPSCGSSKIYDGSFSNSIIDGDGVTVSLLRQKGIEVYNEEKIFFVAERLKTLEFESRI